MYIKKILVVILLMGAVAGVIFAYSVYGKFFDPNTTFNNEEANVYIRTGAMYGDVREELKPFIEDMESLDAVAQRKGYINNIRPGHFVIKKNSGNNDIINSIRSGNIPVKISFNNNILNIK